MIRLPIQSEAGGALSRRWGTAFTPTFILFDGSGREIQRSFGRLDPEAVKMALGQS